MILRGQPWTFDGYVIALQKIYGDEQPSEIKPHTSPFWVRIYDLSLRYRTEEAVTQIGRSFGEVIDFDKSSGCVAGKYMRVKVVLDLCNPLKRGTQIQLVSQQAGKIFFKYERLPDICFACGGLGHSIKSCPDKEDDEDDEEGPQNLPYGAWLRASPKKNVMVRKEGFLEERKSLFQEESSNRTIPKEPAFEKLGRYTASSEDSSEAIPKQMEENGDIEEQEKGDQQREEGLDQVADVLQQISLDPGGKQAEKEATTAKKSVEEGGDDESTEESHEHQQPASPENKSHQVKTGKGASWKRLAGKQAAKPTQVLPTVCSKRTDMDIDEVADVTGSKEKKSKNLMQIDDESAVLEDQHRREP
ncbi:uncharacterized protein LOC130725488 [Lotus japonicus]|uniref:uncharacterized protein LOC130725488 n=1 Tax=Lotus japonicus TaxID=34305 RepID=UPI00258400C0|nr:uncharacterized protein LOC130725488 [Lotus japonicus]